MTVPVNIPETLPVPFIVATEVLLLLHVPPPVASDNVIPNPTHTTPAPTIADGDGITVIVVVLRHPNLL